VDQGTEAGGFGTEVAVKGEGVSDAIPTLCFENGMLRETIKEARL
jgi:hypothetical protein